MVPGIDRWLAEWLHKQFKESPVLWLVLAGCTAWLVFCAWIGGSLFSVLVP
jgi:hypothetical protein